jgi:leucyl aminopeptidase
MTMNITVQRGEIQKQDVDVLVVNLFSGSRPGGATAAVDRALDGQISAAIDLGDFKGEAGQTLLLYPHGRVPARRVLVVGLGAREKFDLEQARRAAATAIGRLSELGARQAATILHGTGAGNLPVEQAARATAEASLLAAYRFDEYRSEKKPLKFARLTVVEFDGAKLAQARRGVQQGLALARATCLARDLINRPGSQVTPSHLARVARGLAREHGLRCQVIEEVGLRRLGMNALLGVARGSAEPPRFIVLEHRGRSGERPLVFVGKGITFDSGGLSLKTGEGMETMKCDMSGAAAVLGALSAVSALKIPRRVVGLIAATENMPSGSAYKPGDVLRALSGKTIEILNTDAEGRLVLADALSYASRFKPAAVVDLATLTGACVTALGHHASGLFANDERLAERLRQAGELTGERLWRLPLWPEYREQIDSDIADMKNTGGRAGGASTAAALLAEFATYPWAHLDIAGTAWNTQSRPYVSKGGTGVGVRLLAQLVLDWKA